MQPGTEEFTERSSIRSAFSTDLGPPPGGNNLVYKVAAWIESVPKRYIVAFMAFLGFCKYGFYSAFMVYFVGVLMHAKNST